MIALLVTILISLYAGLQLWGAVWGRRQGLVSRGAFLVMVAGGLLLLGGAWLHLGHVIAGFWLVAGGLYLISDATYAVGTRRPGGPDYRHHVLRAVLTVIILLVLVVV